MKYSTKTELIKLFDELKTEPTNIVKLRKAVDVIKSIIDKDLIEEKGLVRLHYCQKHFEKAAKTGYVRGSTQDLCDEMKDVILTNWK